MFRSKRYDEFDDMAGGFRARRGMTEPVILSLLSVKSMHGYEIISELEKQSHGMWRPSAGSIYPTLQLLEEKGDVTAEIVGGKKVYTLTNAGKLAAKAAEMKRESWDKRVNSLHLQHREFHSNIHDIRRDMHKIFRSGSSDQKNAMIDAIGDFKKRLKQIIEGEI